MSTILGSRTTPQPPAAASAPLPLRHFGEGGCSSNHDTDLSPYPEACSICFFLLLLVFRFLAAEPGG